MFLFIFVFSLLINSKIRLLNFKIASIDRALQGNDFNITQKLKLLELQDDLVLERYREIMFGDKLE